MLSEGNPSRPARPDSYQEIERRNSEERENGNLIIIRERLRHREVDDIANIRLVDSHSKGNGGADDLK